MPDPQVPLLDQFQLDDAFSKYTGSVIDQKIQSPAFQGLNNPSPDILGSKPLSSLDQLTQDILSPTKGNGTQGPGGKSIPLSQLNNQPFDIYDPSLEGKDEDILSLNQPFLNKAANGLIKMGGIAANTVVSSTLGTINGIGEWINTGRFSSFIDNDFNKQLDENMKTLEAAFPHYRTSHEREGSWYEPENLFTANFLFDNIVKNLGYSIGAAAPALAVGKALNTLRISSKLFAAGEALTATEISQAASQLPRVQQLGYLEGKFSQSIGKALTKLGAPAVGGKEQAGTLVRGIASALSSVGEASMEGYNNLNEFRQKKIEEYKQLNGIDPTGQDLEDINSQARDVATSSFALNMALLSGTEYVQLPKIFSSTFKGEKNLLNRTVRNAETGLLEAPKQTLLRKTANVAGLAFNKAEAFEEGAQYTIQTGTQDYYNKKYKGQDTDFLSSLFTGVGETLSTDEGLENIFLGGLSGALMTARGKFLENKEKSSNTSQFVADANKTQFNQFLKEGVDQANRATTLQEQRAKAIRQGEILESKDLEFDYAHNYLSHRIKWGRFDLVQDDINSARQQASTQEGFIALQQEGKAAENDTQATFLARLNNIEINAKNVRDQYEYLNNKYTGTYSPEVIDKLVYTASKVKDYDQRIPELSRDLLAQGIQVQNVLEEALSLPISERESRKNLSQYQKDVIASQTEELSPLKEALKNINSLQTVSEVKDDLRQKLQDVIEIANRRADFIKEYDSIKTNPSTYTETTSTPDIIAPTVKIKTRDGEEDLIVGEEYFLGNVVDYTKEGKEVYRFPKLTILGENSDGTIKIKDGSGQVRDVSKDVLADYKLGKVSDTLNNKKAKFFMENVNTIFEFNFGKGKTKIGRLEYSNKNRTLIFVYKDGKKIKRIEVTGDQFEAQEGYKQAMIEPIGDLTAAQQESLNAFKKEKDDRTKAKRETRLKIITEVFDETSSKLEKTKNLLQQKYSELEKVISDLQSYENKIKAGDLTNRNNFKSSTNKAIKAANRLSRMQEDLRLEIQELEAEQETLEFNESYLADMAQNIDELPTNSSEFLEELNDQVLDLQILHEETGKQINKISSLIDKVENALKSAIDFVLDTLKSFSSKYPKVPTAGGQEWVDFLKANPNFLKLQPNFKEDLRTTEELISDIEDFDISPTEEKSRELRTQLESLQSDLSSIEKELAIKEQILSKFQGAVQEYKEAEKKKEAFAKNKAVQQKYFQQQRSNENLAGDPIEESKEQTSSKKDLAFALVTSTDPAWEATTKDNNFHRRHQTFLFNSTSTNPQVFSQEEYNGVKAKDRLRILPITSNTYKELGFPEDWIEPEYRFNGSNADVAAIRYVYVLEEGAKLFFVSENGQKISEVGSGNSLNPSEIIYSNATTTTDKDFTNKDKLSESELKTYWGGVRKDIFNINGNSILNFKGLEFRTSRGFPFQIPGENRQTTVLEAKLASQEDIDNNQVVEVPTASSRFPAGIPIYNFNGNTVFLNNKNFTREQATDIVDVLTYAASHNEGLTNEVFNYLRNVLYFSTSVKGEVKRNQIFLKDQDGFPILVVGANQVEIPFIGFSTEDGNDLVNKREELILAIEGMYHHVNNTSLKNKAPFTELQVVDGELKTKKAWNSYQNYLLSGPLTTNIVIPQEGEIPIREKYSIVSFPKIQDTSFKPTEAPKPAPKEEVKEQPKGKTLKAKSNNIDFTFNLTDTEATITSAIDAEGNELVSVIPPDAIESIQNAFFQANKPKQPTVSSEVENIERKRKESLASIKREVRKVMGEENTYYLSNLPTQYKNAPLGDFSENGLKEKINAKYDAEIANLSKTGNSTDDSLDLLNGATGDYIDEDQYRSTLSQFKTGDKAAELAEVRRMLPNVNIQMVDNLIKMIGGGQAWGAARSGFIELFKDAPFGTAFHEAFEQVFNWVLSPSQQQDLVTEFKTRQGNFTTFEGTSKPFSEATAKEAKEQMSEEFIDYKENTPAATNKILQFFKDLWSLVKSIFQSKPETLANVFNKLNQGQYANIAPREALNIEYRERNVQGEAISFVNTVLAGMTADIFINKWKSDVSLILDLEEKPAAATKQLFDDLLGRLTQYYENPQNQSGVISYFKSQLDKATSPEEKASVVEQFTAVRDAWKRVKAQWGNYTEDLKSFLKVFDISFQVDEEGNIQIVPEEELDDKNQLEYVEDSMTVNAKNSASKVVKLLMATVADSEFVKSTIINSLQTRDLAQTRPIRDNVMRMRMLAPYAKLFNYVLYNTANVPGIYNMFDKLTNLSTNTNLKQNANLKSLLDRLKYNSEKGFEGLSVPEIKLLLKLENALSKQKPSFVRQQLTEDGKTVFKFSNIYDRTSQLSEQWNNGLKSLKYVSLKGDDITFDKSILANDPYIFLSNLNIPITRNSFPLSKEKELLAQVDVIKKLVSDHTTKPIGLTSKGKKLGVDSRIAALAKFYVQNIEGESTESQHLNMSGKVTANFVLPNYISHVLSDVNIAPTLERFIELNQQYKDIYMGNSYFLNNILYKNGQKNNPLSITVLEGKNIYADNRPTDKMNEGERMLYEINNNLNGVYYTLMPSDSKTEYGLNVGNLVPETFFNSQGKAKATSDYVDQMYSSYLNEIDLVNDYENRKNISALTRKVDGVEVGKQLRFFKYILDNPKTTLSKEEFRTRLLNYITEQANTNIQDLKSWKIIDGNTVHGMDANFMSRVFNRNDRQANLSAPQILELFQYREMNYVFSNIEMHKLFFNDPAQYKDELKRTKSFMSGREYAHVDTLEDSRGLNQALNNQLNKGLIKTDPGYHQFKNHLNSVTIREIQTVSKEFDNIKKVLGAKADKYSKMEIADAQSWMTGNAYRETLYKSGGRFTAQQEELHQWLLAFERSDKSKLGTYTYSSKDLQAQDEKTLSLPIPSTDKHIMYVLKPIVSGTKYQDGIAIQYLYKTSTAPLYYYFVKNTPLEGVYNKITEKNIDFLAMESANKVGILKNNTLSLLNEEGQVSQEFDSVITTPIDFKYFGIQVDTASKKEEQTQGSQLTKLAVIDLMDNGIPVDFIKANSKLNVDEIREAWAKSPNSKISSLIKEHNDTLIALAIKRSEKIFNKLGIKKDEFGYSYRDKAVVAEFILSELERRELPDNIKQGIGVKYNPDTNQKEFINPLESNVNYAKIKQILWSVIEKNLTRPKMSGGPKVQMSVAGTGNIKKTTINGKDVYVDDTLKFYSQGEGKTNACEIDLPYFFGQELRAKFPQFSTDEEFHSHLIDYLNKTEEGQSLLTGIGFRIPTQGLNSIEYFKVRKFLAPQLGDVVILPAEITTKAGSDFDVDKLNMYLKNWYIGKSGYPKVVKFRNINSNSTQELTDLYEYTLKNKRKAWDNNQSVSNLFGDIFPDSQEDIEYAPSLEEFLEQSKGKSSLELNSEEALQNKYYETLENLISLPENFEALITPNDASQMDNLSQDIQKLTNNIDKDITPGDLINSNFMAKKRNTMLASKGSVGISAVSSTNLALNQLNDITIEVPNSYVKNNVKIRLPHNTINGKPSLSSIKTTSRDFISNINSQVTDGTVDVAKKEWLPRMGFTDKMISTALLMNKWGTPIRNIAFFLNQPAIKTYMKEQEIYETMSLYNRNLRKKSQYELQDHVNKIIAPGQNIFALRKNKPQEYTLKMLEAMISKAPNELTKPEQALQLQILDDFLGYQAMAWQLFNVVQGYNYDTSRITSPEDVYAKEIAEEKAYSSTVDSYSKFVNNTYIGTIRNSVKDINNALKSLLNTQVGEAGNIIRSMSFDLKKHKGIGNNKDNYSKYMNKAEAALIDYIVQNAATINSQPLNTFIKPLLSSAASSAHYIQKLKQDIYNNSEHPLRNNKFLQNIITDIDVTNTSPSTVSIAEPDFDTFTSDSYTDQFRELLSSGATVQLTTPNTARTVGQVFENLVVAQILQNGSSRKAGSFFHLIPNEIYNEYASPVLNNIAISLSNFYDNGLFYRNNARDTKLVPVLRPDYESLTGENEFSRIPVNGKPILFVKSENYLTYPFTKIVDRQTGKIRLYKRVDSFDDYGQRSPVLIKKSSGEDIDSSVVQNVAYQEVTVLGSDKVQEYYADSLTSAYSPKIEELSDASIIRAIEATGLKTSYKNISSLEENELPLEDTITPQDKINSCLGKL